MNAQEQYIDTLRTVVVDFHSYAGAAAAKALEREIESLWRDIGRGNADELGSLVRCLHLGSDPVPSWWASPLGRMCVPAMCEVLGDDAVMTQSEAAAALGVHPGTVAKLVHRGTLAAEIKGGVLVAAVRDRITRLNTTVR